MLVVPYVGDSVSPGVSYLAMAPSKHPICKSLLWNSHRLVVAGKTTDGAWLLALLALSSLALGDEAVGIC